MGFFCIYIWIIKIYKGMENDINIFKTLTPTEEVEFRKWARDNFKPGYTIRTVWHPIVKAECHMMNMECSPFERWNLGIESNPGSFQQTIFEAYRIADQGNQEILTKAFPYWFERRNVAQVTI
jgi:hypothetical protein